MSLKEDFVTHNFGGTEYKFRYCQMGRRLAQRAGQDPELFLSEGIDESERASAFLYVSALPYHRDIDPETFMWASPIELIEGFYKVLNHSGLGGNVDKEEGESVGK